MAAEVGFVGLGQAWGKPVAGISTASLTAAGIVGSKHWVLTIWLVAVGLILLFLAFCVEYEREKSVKTQIFLGALVLCVVAAGALTKVSVALRQSTSITKTDTKSATESTTQVKNSAATQRDNSPAIAGGSGNSVSYGTPSASTTTHKRSKQ